jgi:hypothetical protein
MASAASAQEIVTINPRPGVTQSFFIANMGQRRAAAIALLFIGGRGNIRLRTEGGQIRFEQGNFLPRSRLEFVRNNVLPVIMDNPSDQQDLSDAFRASAEHVTDVRAAIAEVKRRYPGLPVFLVGTSRSTISVAWLSKALGNEIAGAVESSSLWATGRPRQMPVLSAFDWSSIRVPLLFVHHRDDQCPETAYREAARLADRYPLISVKGGKPPESGPCDPLSAHGFFGMEARTVEAIANWMFGRPYAKDIE